VFRVKVEEEWEKTMCGCNKCFHKGYFDPKKMPEHLGQCFKKMALEEELFKKSKQRFEPSVSTGEFKPASREQIAEWTAWLSSREAKAAEQRLASMEEAAINKFGETKWDPVKMEHDLLRYVPKKDHDIHVVTDLAWTAYRFYGNEQIGLLKNYKKSSKVNTKEDYDKAEKAYKALSNHVNKHGQIIEEMPKHIHKMPKDIQHAAPKMGRRASRKAKRELAASTETGRVYSRAELRALARGDGEGSVESDKDE